MDKDPEDFKCYSVRRLNPFLGTVQIIQTSSSRAISLNGAEWDIQILAESPNDTWSTPSPVKPKRQFLRFGVWDETDGLSRVPANPLLNLTSMIQEADRLVEILVVQSKQVPFTASDKFELWLLDDLNQAPQALLASTIEAGSIHPGPINEWICSNREFPSNLRYREKTVSSKHADSTPNKSHLEAIVKQRAERNLQRWFKRDEDGGGVALLSSESEHRSTAQELRLPAKAFPLLLLNTRWDEPLIERFISDYHAWLSPLLLTLQNIPDELRITLEEKAVKQALAVNACWRLYPKIIDRKIIDTARVEAQLRRSGRI